MVRKQRLTLSKLPLFFSTTAYDATPFEKDPSVKIVTLALYSCFTFKYSCLNICRLFPYFLMELREVLTISSIT